MRSEDDLRAAMQLSARDAPAIDDVLRRAGSAPRRRGLLPVAAAAAIVLVVVLSVAALVRGHGGSDGPSGPVPASLVDVGWRLTSVRTPDGSLPVGGFGMVLRRSGHAAVGAGFCRQLEGTARFGSRTATFSLTDVALSCPPPLPSERVARARLAPGGTVIAAVLRGTVDWSLTADTLRISRPGVGTVTYSRGSVDPPSPGDS